METFYIKIILTVIFTLAVLGKLTGKTKSTFEQAGYGREEMYAVAMGEILFTILLFSKYELIAAFGLLAIIGGALFTLFRLKASPAHYSLASAAAILLIVLLITLIR